MPFYFLRISNAIFLPASLCAPPVSMWDQGRRQRELITGTPQQTLRVTIGVATRCVSDTRGGERWAPQHFMVQQCHFGDRRGRKKMKRATSFFFFKDPLDPAFLFLVSLPLCSSTFSLAWPTNSFFLTSLSSRGVRGHVSAVVRCAFLSTAKRHTHWY